MNLWQILRQFQYRILGATWPENSSAKIVSECRISAGRRPENLSLAPSPFVLLNAGTDAADEDHPERRTGQIEMVLGVTMEPDEFGESVLMGGGGDFTDDTYSSGKGLMEVEGALLSVISSEGDALGMRMHMAHAGAVTAGYLDEEEGGKYLAARTYRFVVEASSLPFYHPPINLKRSGGTVSWILPPDRFDRLRVIVTRKSGTTPPADPDDGTRLTLASDLATSVADATAAPVSFAAFAAYDDYPEGLPKAPSTERAYSDAGTGRPGTTWVEAS